MADKRVVMRALEPAEMSVPAMDRPSLVLAWFMDNIIIDWDDEHEDLLLVCNVCMTGICKVEATDTLRVLFNTALAHGC